jgi:hypothetical protein
MADIAARFPWKRMIIPAHLKNLKKDINTPCLLAKHEFVDDYDHVRVAGLLEQIAAVAPTPILVQMPSLVAVASLMEPTRIGAFPDNLWIGARATTGRQVVEWNRRLDETSIARRWLWVAPSVNILNITPFLRPDRHRRGGFMSHKGDRFEFVMLGNVGAKGETPINVRGARTIVRQCRRQGVPLFFTGWGEQHLPLCQLPKAGARDAAGHFDINGQGFEKHRPVLEPLVRQVDRARYRKVPDFPPRDYGCEVLLDGLDIGTAAFLLAHGTPRGISKVAS